MEERPTLDAGQAAQLDAAYQPISTFEEWRVPLEGARGWDTAVEGLTRARETASPEDFRSLVEEAFRQASIDTGAIEGLYETDRGFTMTVAAMAATWEAAVEQAKGFDVVELVTGHLEGYEMALDAATRSAPITEAWLRQLQAVICAGQGEYDVITTAGPQRAPLPKGEYKRHANHVLQADGSTHAYAPVDETPIEVQRLVDEFRLPAFESAHPAEQAAYAHHALTSIHPFPDGNGRTARALASVFLLRSVSLPLVVFADQRPQYLEALRASDHGATNRLVGFVLDRTVDTMFFVSEKLSDMALDTATTVAKLDQLHRLPDGMTYVELHSAAERLLAIATDELKAVADNYELPPGVRFSTGMSGRATDAPPAGWTMPSNIPTWPMFSLYSDVHRSVGVDAVFEVLIANEPETLGVALRRAGSDRLLMLRVSDIHPQLGALATDRIGMWARREINLLVNELVDLAAR